MLTFEMTDNPEVIHGMPINLQLVARRLEEEKVLAMTKMVVDALEAPNAQGVPTLL